ncbi:BTAD domain-containing putative transcriptional regulator [Actinomycetospora termitidis]|uniref:BTAD domain-containing putative transcriptional regulator n=1 Tax=Actinomycetospora termitidis TaxID=3053470 RepID=A0ABT7MEF2_9PSEU|nr:BTAD domain-containing putative transcriptional regulator [Actinomycetospora sp. Odt1-22]MDL5159045.1 BTAD domain-containing putative transcriptional regulator [Actinomycetospora sp. Odt1-22]
MVECGPIRLLGGLGVEDGVALRTPPGTGLQVLLALLATSPGTPVERDLLCTELWSDAAMPRNPAASLHTRMTRLRDWLGIPRDGLVSATGAYTLQIDPATVDLTRFHRAADAALGAVGPHTVDVADEALAVWGGCPWPGLSSPRLDLARRHAQARHRLVVETRIRGLLEVGRPLEAVDAVTPLVAEEPEVEVWHALLVRALHETGRPREATEAYLAARRHLRAELAVDPGEELREAYRRLLADRARTWTDAGARTGTRLVGREAPLARIAAGLDSDAPDGLIVVVEGEAGIGKSTLLAAARDAARRSATTAPGAWDESRTPMAAWFEALGPPPEGPAGAPVPWVRQRLAELAVDAPVLVTLDDAHHADSASLAALGGLAQHGVPPHVVVLVAARVPDVVPHPDWSACRAELARAAGTVVLTLPDLPPAAVAELVDAHLGRLGRDAVRRLSVLVHRRAGGHPLHTVALLDQLTGQPDEAAAVAAAAQVPDRLRAVLEHQVGRLDRAARRTLEAFAVLRPVPITALAAVLDRSAVAVADDLRAAAEFRLVVTDGDAFDVRHDLVAATVSDLVPAPVRVTLHRTRLEKLPPEADPFARLRHTLGAAPELDDRTVALARRDAGVAAYERRALTEALDLLDDAGEVLRHDLVVLVHRGLVLGALGRLDEADVVLDDAVSRALASRDPDPVLLVRAAVGDEPLGRSVRGDPRRLARLHRTRHLALPPDSRFELLVALLREESLIGTPRPALLAEMRRLAETPGTSVRMRARARALEVRQLVEGPEPAARRLELATDGLELAREAGDPTVVLDATELLMTAALGAGDVERALELRGTLATQATRWHRPRLIWAARVLESALALARGEVESADAGATASLQLGQELGVGDALPAFGVHLMIRNWMAGTADDLGDLAHQAATDNPAMAAWAAAAAVARARGGRRDEAASWLAAFRARRAATSSRLFDRPALCLAACVAWTLGDVETARLVRRELPADPDAVVILGFGAVITGPAALFAGIAAMTLGDLATARADVAAAEKLATSLGWTPWADAAARLGTALDGGVVDLPLGMGGRGDGR